MKPVLQAEVHPSYEAIAYSFISIYSNKRETVIHHHDREGRFRGMSVFPAEAALYCMFFYN